MPQSGELIEAFHWTMFVITERPPPVIGVISEQSAAAIIEAGINERLRMNSKSFLSHWHGKIFCIARMSLHNGDVRMFPVK
jgi:hypothetical protein